MKKILLPVLLALPLLIQAQSRPQLLLNRLPYVPEPTGESRPPMLNSAYALQALEPLPNFNLPQQLPVEFLADAGQRKVITLFTQASERISEGKPEEAIPFLEQAVALNPNEGNLRVSLGDSYYAADRYVDAMREYENVLESSPFHFQCLNNLGWLLATVSDSALRDPQRAMELAERARLIRPNSHHMWSTLSQAQYELGLYPEAEQSIVNALRLAQQNRVPTSVVTGYLLHRDRCVLAREATSLLE
jgi:tetratricopeptide (TPR) repeat protein